MLIMNHFPILDYISPEYFCNRDIEIKKLISAYKNGRNVTLTSIRRLGKTGLIKHLFYKLSNDKSNKNIRLLYIDILKTNNLSDFVKVFSNKILEDEAKNTNWLQKLSKLISGVNAQISIDDKTGAPSFVIGYKSVYESEKSLDNIFKYLASQKEEYLIAFDEFQQIVNYTETNVEAILRTHIQHQHKDKFIFSGSSKHILISMFNDYDRAFYQSSEMLNLDRLNIDEYTEFIHEKFIRTNKKIEKGLVRNYVGELDIHTFYVQYFFNKLFDIEENNITDEIAKNLFQEILREKEYVFLNYRNILTKLQFNLLAAIAKEEVLSSPNASWFIKKYNFTQASSINKTLKSLLQKEMIYKENGGYKVYDVFFSKWLYQL